jgi:hypothetical protein
MPSSSFFEFICFLSGGLLSFFYELLWTLSAALYHCIGFGAGFAVCEVRCTVSRGLSRRSCRVFQLGSSVIVGV